MPLTPEQTAQLVEHFGSQNAAARATGISRAALWGWLNPEKKRESDHRYREYMYWGTDTPETNHKHFLYRAKAEMRSRRHKALKRMTERNERRDQWRQSGEV